MGDLRPIILFDSSLSGSIDLGSPLPTITRAVNLNGNASNVVINGSGVSGTGLTINLAKTTSVPTVVLQYLTIGFFASGNGIHVQDLMLDGGNVVAGLELLNVQAGTNGQDGLLIDAPDARSVQIMDSLFTDNVGDGLEVNGTQLIKQPLFCKFR